MDVPTELVPSLQSIPVIAGALLPPKVKIGRDVLVNDEPVQPDGKAEPV